MPSFIDFFLKILPLFLAFFVGIGAKALRLLSKEDAPVLLRFVLSVSLPAIVILSISRLQLSFDLFLIPLSAVIIVFITYFIASFMGKQLKLPKATYGSFLVGAMVMNSAFALPFFSIYQDGAGLALASFFDIGNSFLIFTFIYLQAIKYGDKAHTDKIEWKKFAKLPPLWALAVALVIKGLRLELAPVTMDFLTLLSNPTAPLVMIALGLYFEPQVKQLVPALVAVLIRNGIGLAIGFALAAIFGLEGLNRTVVITCSALPIGFNTLMFAEMENMDREFAATEVSISLIVALFLIPYLMWIT